MMAKKAAKTVQPKTRQRRTRNSTATTRLGKWQPLFIETLRRHGFVAFACRRAKIARTTAYDLRKIDADFRKQWDDALEDAYDDWERAVYNDNSIAGKIFLLKGARPDKYGERHKIEETRTLHIENLKEILDKVWPQPSASQSKK